jgi:hypothetical protein
VAKLSETIDDARFVKLPSAVDGEPPELPAVDIASTGPECCETRRVEPDDDDGDGDGDGDDDATKSAGDDDDDDGEYKECEPRGDTAC